MKVTKKGNEVNTEKERDKRRKETDFVTLCFYLNFKQPNR